MDLVKLDEMLGKGSAKMINGIHVQIDIWHKVFSDRLLQALQEELPNLVIWPLQYLHVDGFRRYNKTVCGAVTELVQKLLWASRSTMKELAIEFESEDLNCFNFN